MAMENNTNNNHDTHWLEPEAKMRKLSPVNGVEQESEEEQDREEQEEEEEGVYHSPTDSPMEAADVSEAEAMGCSQINMPVTPRLNGSDLIHLKATLDQPLNRLIHMQPMRAKPEAGTPINGKLSITPPPSSHTTGTNEDKRVRKFVCRYCHKAFSLMNVLKVHERIHTGEKPYICDICDKAFNQSGSLNRHKNTHIKRNTDNRNYSCRVCPRQFLHSSQLQEHEILDHGPHAIKSSTSSSSNANAGTTINSHSSSSPASSEAIQSVDSDKRYPSDLATSPNCTTPMPNSDMDSLFRNRLPLHPNDPTLTSPLLNSNHQALPLSMFAKYDPTVIGFPPPIPAGLNLFHQQPPPNKVPISAEKSTTRTAVPRHRTSDAHRHASTTYESNKVTEDAFACQMCPQTFRKRTDLDAHTGQHILQQLNGLPFNLLNMEAKAPNATNLPTGLQAGKHSSALAPMEELLLNVLQNQPQMPSVPPLLLPYGANRDATNGEADPMNTLQQNLLPGATAAATLAALSQLLLPHSNPTMTAMATSLLTNPSLMSTALGNITEHMPKSKLLPTQNSQNNAPPMVDQPLFNSLLKSMTALTGTTVGPPLSEVKPTPRVAERVNVSMADSPIGLLEHGLNLALNDRIRIPELNSLYNAAASLATTSTTSTATTMAPVAMGKTFLDNIQNYPWPLSTEMEALLKPANQPLMLVPKNGLSDQSNHGRQTTHTSRMEQITKLDGSYGMEMDELSGTHKTGSPVCMTNGSMFSKEQVDQPVSPSITGSNWQCNLCDRMFTCSSALRVHYRKHSGERPFVCENCGNAFSQIGTLKRHEQTCHTDTTLRNGTKSVSDSDGLLKDSHSTDENQMEYENQILGIPNGSPNHKQFEEKATQCSSPMSTSSLSILPDSRLTFSPHRIDRFEPTQQSPQTEYLDESSENIVNSTSVKQQSTESILCQLDHMIQRDSRVLVDMMQRCQRIGSIHGCDACQVYFIHKLAFERHMETVHPKLSDLPPSSFTTTTMTRNQVPIESSRLQQILREPSPIPPSQSTIAESNSPISTAEPSPTPADESEKSSASNSPQLDSAVIHSSIQSLDPVLDGFQPTQSITGHETSSLLINGGKTATTIASTACTSTFDMSRRCDPSLERVNQLSSGVLTNS